MPPESDTSPSATPVTRMELLRWLWPHCDHGHVALMYLSADGELRPGWIHDDADTKRAIKTFAAGTLHEERFETATKQGVAYTISDAQRLGLILHRDEMVRIFCLDLDDHSDDGGNLRLLEPLSRFLGASPVVFTSKSGKGLHAFFELGEAMPVEEFVRWFKAWGFNRPGQPELFPKTVKFSQVWMPGEPNADGGDTYVSGTSESAVVGALPEPPLVNLTNKSLGFLRGEATQPGRNAGLNVAAMELGEKGVDRSTAWTLCERGAHLCGLEPDETRATFASGYTKGQSTTPLSAVTLAPSTAPGDHELDGIGHAERFARMHKGHARYCVQEADWYVYKTTRWERSPVDAQAMAKATARTIPDQAARRKASTKPGIKEILYLAASEPGMSVGASEFDADPMLFNCRSGTIDLRTGDLRTHNPADLLRKVSPAGYEPGGRCPHWMAFLGTVTGGDAELLAYLQRVCGYLLTGDVSEQCLFFLFGDGCNGKSVFCSVVQHILGGYAVRAPAELVMKPPRSLGNGPTPDAARLQGARLAVTSELEDGHTLGESRVKDLTGGDRMVARPMYGQPVEFDPTHKLLLYGNHKPEIRGVDHGIWRRIRLIPFDVTIPESQRDPHLLDTLRAESDAILAWMAEGCRAWRAEGLGMPGAVRRATGAFRSDSDQVGRFIEECCTLADGVETPKAAVYVRYQAWCEQAGERKLSGKALHPRMEAHGLVDGRSKSARTWIGVSLREDDA